MGIMDDKTKEEVRKKLSGMEKEVSLIYFDQPTQLSEQTKMLLQELAETVPKVKLEMYDAKSEQATMYNIDRGPVVLFRSEYIHGDPRFYGAPAGYEFATVLEMLDFASKPLKVGAATAAFLARLDKPLKLEVFVTPSCPYCPTSAYVALKLAAISDKVQGYVYEAMEFPELSQKYGVSGVPKTVINEGTGEYVGGYPEDMAILQLKKILGFS